MKKQYDALFAACIGNIDYSELAALLENMETAHVKEYFEANNYALFQSLAENENTMTIPLLLQFINKHKINVKAAFESDSHQALQQIMTNANPEAIKLLLQFAIEHNVDIEAAFQSFKYKAINYIAGNKNVEAAILLLNLAKSSGIDIKEMLVMSGSQALDIAAQNEEIAIIELLLSLIEEYGLDIKTALKAGNYTAFRSAIQNSNAKVIELLFELSEKHGIDIAEALQVAEYYIFQVAARSNNLDIIKLLLNTSKKVGIDIETAFSSGGCNTFRCMVSNTNFDVIKFLLQFAKENKIDLAAIFSANNYCAFQRITGNRNADVVNLLLETTAQEYGINIKTAIAANNYSIFIYALQNTNTDVIKLLFKYCEKHNVDIKAVIEAGNYAIFRSIAFKENYYNVKSLLETSEKVGADINAILKIHGYRMLQHAIESGDSNIVNLLLDLSYKHNLDVKATLEQSHYKALQWIAQSHNANIAKLLIKFAKENEINLKAVFVMNNYKALQLAARNSNSEILDLFLQELTNIKENDVIALLHKIFDTIHIFPKRSIIIMLSHFIDLIETKDQKLEFNWFQYDRLNNLLKNSIFQNIELSEVNRYSIISSACKLAVLRKNVPGFLASKEEIEKWNEPNGVRKLSIIIKDLISSDKNSSNNWIKLNKNLKAYILAFLTGDLGDYHNYSQVLMILRKSPYSKSMLKPSNVSSNSLSNDKPFDDFSGNGLSDYEQSIFTDIETQYYSDALHKLLALRLESVKEILSQDTVTIVRLSNIWQPGFDSAISELVLHAITKFSAHKDIGTMLAPINLYGKHWVGLILEKASECIFEIHYIDSANRAIDENIKIALAHAFADYDIKVKISELAVPEQKYGNCGSELIENFILYLTGQRMSQEDAITVHYALLEDSLSDSQYTYRNSSQIEISRNVKSTWYNDNKTNLKIRHDLREHVLKQGFSYNPETMDTKTLKQLHYFLETGVLFNSAANALGATDEGYTTQQQTDNPCDEYDIPCLIIYKMTDFLS